jgi:hypothetical protein
VNKYEINWRRFQGNTWRLPTFRKRLNLYSFYGNVRKKSVVTRMSLRSDKDVETYLLKSRSDDNEKKSCYSQFIRVFNFYKENYVHDIPLFLNFYKKKLFTYLTYFSLDLQHFCRNNSKSVFSYHWTCYIINFLKCFGWLSPDFSEKRKYCAIFLVHWKREYFL